MLGRLWRWLKQFWQRKKNATPPPQAIAKPTDAELEATFLQVLEGVSQGWSQGRVKGFLIGKKLNSTDFLPWLHSFGERLQESPTQHEELAERLVRLGGLHIGELSEEAGKIGRRLDAEIPKPPKAEVIEAEFIGNGLTVVEENLGEEDNSWDAEAWFDKGNEQYIRGNFLGAITSFDQALHYQRDFRDAWYHRGSALFDLGKIEEALASYGQALHYKPDFFEALYHRGVVWRNLGKLEAALASFNQALTVKRDFPNTWYHRGNVLEQLGKLEEAIASFDQAIHYKQDFSEAWNNRGIALEKLGKIEEAIASYNQALIIKPDDSVALRQLRKLGRL